MARLQAAKRIANCSRLLAKMGPVEHAVTLCPVIGWVMKLGAGARVAINWIAPQGAARLFNAEGPESRRRFTNVSGES
jgi:hypothetical protein